MSALALDMIKKQQTLMWSISHEGLFYYNSVMDFEVRFDRTRMVVKIHSVPNQSIQPNETPKNMTEVSAADKGSAQASKLVSVAVKYFKLSK